MFAERLISRQVMDFMPFPTFRRCVSKYQGDFRVGTFSCLDQFLCMAFAQLTGRVCTISRSAYDLTTRSCITWAFVAEFQDLLLPKPTKNAIPEALFASSRKGYGASMRPNNLSYRVLCKQALPRHSASSEIQGFQHRQDHRVSHQQFHFASIHDSPVVSQSLAGRTILQVNQVTPEEKVWQPWFVVEFLCSVAPTY